MDDIDLKKLEEALVHIYDTTPDNICGMAFGYKSTNGALQMQPSVIFYVESKKPADEIPEEERIPATIEIDGKTYVTDVVETPPGSVRALATCHNTSDQSNPEIARLQGFPSALIPMRGGQEIVMFPDGANRYGGISVGTLGFFAIDNEDDRVVGVTNTHVVVDPVLYAKDVARPISSELQDAKNVAEPRTWAFDGKKYPAGALIRDGGVAFHPAALNVKRYVPMHSTLQLNADATLENKVDAALLIMNNAKFGDTDLPFVSTESFTIRRPSDIEAALQDAPYYPFASTAEIDALASTLGSSVNYAYITGRTTGPKGYCPAARMAITSFSAMTPDIGYGNTLVKFKNTLTVEPAPGSDPSTIVGAGGDSGSAVLAQVIDTETSSPMMKIVGILFAGQGDRRKIWACRIDNVAETLNIRGWDSSYNFAPETSLSLPTPRFISQEIATTGDQLYVTPTENENVKYWHAGCTLQHYPVLAEDETATINLTNNEVYENNLVGKVIGDFAVVRPGNNSVIIDAYNYALVSGDGADDNASFTVFANQLRAAVAFNYEEKTTYSIRVRATNSGGISVDKIFEISVKNIEELTPTNITLSPASVSAGTAGRLVGTLAAVSPSATDTFDYYLVNGTGATDNALFAIVNTSLFTAAELTFDSVQASNNEKSIRVQVRNRYNLVYEKVLTVTVTQ